ncbi:MAG: DUF368 domain-containing protein [Lachnospiraceae bacterium]
MVKNIWKGMLIGLANIIPGVSGGTIAVSMGIYDRLIHCICHFFTEIKKNIIFLAPLALGMGIAIIASIFGIDYLFDAFPIQTNLLFIGLILGSLPSVYGKVRRKPVKAGHIAAAILFFAVVVGMSLMKGSSGHAGESEIGGAQVLILFLVGVVAAGTMVVPGVSGSMILLLLGYYDLILDTVKEFFVALVRLHMDTMLGTLWILVPFGIGVLAGIVVIARLIEVVFNRFPMYAYWSIIGLLLASPIAIVLMGSFPPITAVRVLTGIVTFILGWLISGKLGGKE